MSALEQSLDAIIAQNNKGNVKKPVRRNVKSAIKPTTRAGKRAQVGSKNLIQRPHRSIQQRPRGPANPAPKSQPNSTKVNPYTLDVATKVVVSGLPKDIKQNIIKEFFQTKVGPVNSLTLAYNERGRSTGVATVIFKNPVHARKAVSQYNNASLDYGSGKLKLELVVDTANIPLAARIQPVRPAATAPPKTLQQRKARVAAAVKGRPVKPVKQQKKPVQKRPKKKTIEELDQEMADYFATNEK